MVAADKPFEEIEKYLAFSCVGRFDPDKGCDWTMGGLFQLHELEVVTEDGKHNPRFEVASPAMTQAHKENV